MTKKTSQEELKKMLKAGVHFGHRESKWHPKMASFIFGARNNVHIIDLEKTAAQLEEASSALQKVVAAGGTVLFVGAKKQAALIIKKYAQEVNMPYVTERWLGGTLTNFSVIHRLVKNLNAIEKQEASEDYEKKYNKKERHNFSVEKERLLILVGGIRTLEKLPDIMFVLDIREEKTALREAVRTGVPVVAVVDTNVNPDQVTYPIPANDDATKSIEYITSKIAAAVQKGLDERTEAPVSSEKAEAKEEKNKKDDSDAKKDKPKKETDEKVSKKSTRVRRESKEADTKEK